MTKRLHSFAWFIALTAIMLQAVLPAGWMPIADGAGGSRLVICTGHGPLADKNRTHDQAPSGHENSVCPFAALGHLAPPAFLALLPAPAEYGRESAPSGFATALLSRRPDTTHPPRAPPSFA